MLRSKKWSWLKAWAMKIARHRGMKKAIVALARRLAVIVHRIWADGPLAGDRRPKLPLRLLRSGVSANPRTAQSAVTR